jgi:hypothetical protein
MNCFQRISFTSSFFFTASLALGACSGDDSGETETSTTASTMTASTTAGTGTDTAGTDTDPSETGTTTGGLDGAFCAHQCSADADCLVGGSDIGLTCKDSFCTGDGGGDTCADDFECVALFSGWMTPCTAGGGECDAMAMVCIKYEGEGRCALPPSDFVMCDAFGFDDLEVEDIDGAMVTVCAKSAAECGANGACSVPCKADTDCTSGAYPVCDTNTGICGCATDDHCATLGLAQASTCNAGLCGCGADADCVSGKAGDLCMSGSCGCSADAACADVTNSFDGGMISCVSF